MVISGTLSSNCTGKSTRFEDSARTPVPMRLYQGVHNSVAVVCEFQTYRKAIDALPVTQVLYFVAFVVVVRR